MIQNYQFQSSAPAWYCARTKPKNEHIAAATLRKNLRLEVFNPRLRFESVTYHGVRHVTEALFPGYIFVRCVIEEWMDQIRYTNGISSIVHFGWRIPTVPESVIRDLQVCFGAEERLVVDNLPVAGDEVTLAAGAFSGMKAVVLRTWPSKRRVQVLLEILGRPTAIEMDHKAITLEKKSVAALVAELAAPRLAAY